jgi:hypothetical protein
VLPHPKVRKILDATFGIVDEKKSRYGSKNPAGNLLTCWKTKGLPYWQAFCFCGFPRGM